MKLQSVFAQEILDFMTVKKAEYGSDYVHRNWLLLVDFDQYLFNINLSVNELSEEAVAGWIKTLKGSCKTRSNKISYLRNFIRYLRAIGFSAFLPKLPRNRSSYIPHIFSEEELNSIFSAADNFSQPKQTLSPYLYIEMPMFLRLLYGCGLRRGEALSLTMRDVDLDHGIFTLRKTKGGKERFVPMESSLLEILRQYCNKMNLTRHPECCLFPGKTLFDPLAGGVVQAAFCAILSSSGITFPGRIKHERGPCLHCFRHLFVSKSILQAEKEGRAMNNYDIVLPTFLGHEDFRYTDEYIHFNIAMLSEAGAAFEQYTKGMIPEVLYEEE